jgi:hypothetical protein
MALRQNLDDLDANGLKGDWCFANDDHLIIVRWGDDINDIAILRINTFGIEQKTSWNWDGSHESPTLSPSILVRGDQSQPEKWHGYLRSGKLEEA